MDGSVREAVQRYDERINTRNARTQTSQLPGRIVLWGEFNETFAGTVDHSVVSLSGRESTTRVPVEDRLHVICVEFVLSVDVGVMVDDSTAAADWVGELCHQ